MRITQGFEDLESFVEAYRGRVSREGVIVYTDTPFQEGTVLELNVTLAGSLPLIRGTAGVVQQMRAEPDSGDAYSVVLEFLDLDPDSEGFLIRLVDRFASEGAPLLRMDAFVFRGRRRLRGPSPPPDAGEPGTSSPEGFATSRDHSVRSDVAERVSIESARRRRARRGGQRWIVGASAATAAAALAALAVITSRPWSFLAPSTAPAPAVSARERASVAAPFSEQEVLAGAGRSILPSPRDLPGKTSPGSNRARATRIEGIRWTDSARTTLVTIQADGTLDEATVGHFLMADQPEPRLVLYLYGIGSSGLTYRTEVGGDRLGAVRVWYHDDKVPVQLHIVLDLTNEGVDAGRPEIHGDRLEIMLTEGQRAIEGRRPGR